MTAPAQGTASSDNWQFQLTPYLWIVSISGRSGIGNLIIDTDTSVTDTGVELNFGFMSTFEARKNKFVFLTDLQYSDLSTEKGNPGPLFSSTRASFKTFVLDPEVGYRILGKADLAGGGSNFTYQLFGGVGINVGERLALVGGYRDLSVNYNKDGFLFDNSLHGPVLGFGIKF